MTDVRVIGGKTVIIYHGSNVEVAVPRLIPQNRFLDFGFGFYTTTNKKQAIAFADKVYRRKKSGARTVSVYELNESVFSDCSVLEFTFPDESWLDFVSANRSGEYNGEKYDLVIGPVADDDVYATFALYSAGVLTKVQTLEALKIKKLFNQLVFSSEKALGYIKFIGVLDRNEFDGTKEI